MGQDTSNRRKGAIIRGGPRRASLLLELASGSTYNGPRPLGPDRVQLTPILIDDEGQWLTVLVSCGPSYLQEVPWPPGECPWAFATWITGLVLLLRGKVMTPGHLEYVARQNRSAARAQGESRLLRGK